MELTSFLNALPGAISQGLVWGIMAIGVYITYKLLDIADLTVDGSLATGGAVVAAQYLGSRDEPNACAAAKQLFYAIAALSTAMMAVCLLFREPILRLVFGTLDDDVMTAAMTYFLLTAISYPFLAVYNAGAALFRAMGKSILYEGPAGFGQHTKMANQIAIAGALAGVCEALTYAKRAGLDPARVYETIRTGAARSGQLDIIAPKVLNGDFSAAFYLRHFVKDMGIASQECRDRGLELEVLEQVLADCRQIEAEGHGGEGTQALIRHYPWAD